MRNGCGPHLLSRQSKPVEASSAAAGSEAHIYHGPASASPFSLQPGAVMANALSAFKAQEYQRALSLFKIAYTYTKGTNTVEEYDALTYMSAILADPEYAIQFQQMDGHFVEALHYLQEALKIYPKLTNQDHDKAFIYGRRDRPFIYSLIIRSWQRLKKPENAFPYFDLSLDEPGYVLRDFAYKEIFKIYQEREQPSYASFTLGIMVYKGIYGENKPEKILYLKKLVAEQRENNASLFQPHDPNRAAVEKLMLNLTEALEGVNVHTLEMSLAHLQEKLFAPYYQKTAKIIEDGHKSGEYMRSAYHFWEYLGSPESSDDALPWVSYEIMGDVFSQFDEAKPDQKRLINYNNAFLCKAKALDNVREQLTPHIDKRLRDSLKKLFALLSPSTKEKGTKVLDAFNSGINIHDAIDDFEADLPDFKKPSEEDHPD